MSDITDGPIPPRPKSRRGRKKRKKRRGTPRPNLTAINARRRQEAAERRGEPAQGVRTDGGSFLDAFNTVFKDWFAGDSWGIWRIVAKSIFAEPLTDGELQIFTKHTGRTLAQSTPAREVWLACGRRAGKDYFVAALVVWLACYRRYPLKLGDLGRVMLLAVDSDQADVLMSYVSELVDSIPRCAALVKKRSVKYGSRRIEFSTGIEILIKVADRRRVRGRTLVACVADEIAHWFSDEHHVNPDKEVLKAIRPSMLGMPGALLLCISSPHRRAGELWETDQRVWGKNGDPVLFWRAATWEMRPDTPGHRAQYPTFQDELEAEKTRDLSEFNSEYGAQYRLDLEDYLTLEQIQAVTVDRDAIEWTDGMKAFAFLDGAGGEGQDSQALAIAIALPGGRAALAKVLEWRPPFDHASTIPVIAATCRDYRVHRVTGDNFGGGMAKSALAPHRLSYEMTPLTSTKIYQAFAAAVTGKRVELLGAGRTAQRGLQQLVQLERRLGGEKIVHPNFGHDDVAVVIAGACLLALDAAKSFPPLVSSYTQNTAGQRWIDGQLETQGKTGMSAGYHGPDAAAVHPHECAVDMRSEWDAKLGSRKADRMRKAWTAQPAPQPTSPVNSPVSPSTGSATIMSICQACSHQQTGSNLTMLEAAEAAHLDESARCNVWFQERGLADTFKRSSIPKRP